MQAIEVKFISRTDAEGASLEATCRAGSITCGWKHELDDNNYRHAANLLQQKLGWDFKLVEGILVNGNYVYTFGDKTA